MFKIKFNSIELFALLIWNVLYRVGQISVDATLDRETTSSYNLVIKAKDNGSPSKSATASVTITIIDVNDNRPKFNKNPFRFQVREDASNQKNIGRIVASDKDTGDNARLTYELIGNGSLISVDANGDVKLIGNIDYERTKRYSYDIKVSDNGVPKLSSYGKLVIEVIVYLSIQKLKYYHIKRRI